MLEGFVLPGTPLPVFWAFCFIGVLIQGVSKSGFAGGAGILSLPLMLLVMPVAKVAAVLLPILILCDFNAIYHHRRNKDWPAIRAVYLPSLIGIAAGAAVWWRIGREGVDEYGVYVKQFVGCVAVLFAFYLIGKEAALKRVEHYRPGPLVTLAAGVSAGFTSTIAHAAGPIVSLYLYTLGLGKSRFVGTSAWTFTFINLTKLPFYIAVGLIDPSVLVVGAFLLPAVPLGSALGHWMHHRIDERPFNRVILALTLLAALQLLTGLNLVTLAVEALR